MYQLVDQVLGACIAELTPVFSISDEREGNALRRRGRPRKRQNIQGKRLFEEHSSGEEDDSISASDQEDAQDQDEEEENAPLIHSFRSSGKLKFMRGSREENRTKTGAS